MNKAQAPQAMRSEHGSRTLDEFKARMRDAGYENWEIEEEVAEMIDAQEQVKRNTEEFKAKEGKAAAADAPAFASSFALYQDNAGHYHLFALDQEDRVLGTCLLNPLQEREVIKETDSLREDPTHWLYWDAPAYDASQDYEDCKRGVAMRKGSCELIEEWNARLPLNTPSLKDESRSAIAASRELASARTAACAAKEAR